MTPSLDGAYPALTLRNSLPGHPVKRKDGESFQQQGIREMSPRPKMPIKKRMTAWEEALICCMFSWLSVDVLAQPENQEAETIPSVRTVRTHQLARSGEERSISEGSVVAYYRFEGGTNGVLATGGNSIIDSSGNGASGTPFGTVTWSSNVAVNPIPLTGTPNLSSVEFDGFTGRIAIPDYPFFSLTKSLTLEAYIDALAPACSGCFAADIVFRGDDRPGLDPYKLLIDPEGNLAFQVTDINDNAARILAPITLGRWHHVAGTLDDSTGNMLLYIDGEQVASTNTAIRPFGTLTGANPGLGIGDLQSDSSPEHFTGYIDEVRISSSALPPTQFLDAAQGHTQPELAFGISFAATNFIESEEFLMSIHVTNTSAIRLDGIHLAEFYYGEGSTADIIDVTTINPYVLSIPRGKVGEFTQRLRAATAGTFSLSVVLETSDGTLLTNSSPTAMITPTKLGRASLSDGFGNARFKIGKTMVPVHLTDADTGSSLSDFALGLALDPRRPGQALISAVDKLGRYPPQFFLLQGSTNTTESELREERQVTLQSALVELPVAQICEPSATVFTEVLAPFPAPALGPLAPPPPPTVKEPDPIQTALYMFLNSINSMVDETSSTLSEYFTVTTKQVTCGDAVAEDVKGILVGVGKGKAQHAAVVAANSLGYATTGAVLKFAEGPGVGDLVSGMQTFGDLINCYGPDPAGVLYQHSVVAKLPYFSPTLFSWNSRDRPPEEPIPVVYMATEITDAAGTHVPSGVMMVLSTQIMANGFVAPISDGSASVPVTQAPDTYDYCVHAPGYLPQSGQITVTSTAPSLQVVMSPQPAVSATLSAPFGQSTSFLPEGTSFALTAHFLDASNHEVQCSGAPMFYAHNPVGASIAVVDPDSGVVTIQGGCGAARIYAWCGGVESQPFLVSSDCNGAEPPPAFSTFAVSPTHLAFVATEGAANPPCQSFYVVNLTETNESQNISWNRDWISLTSIDTPADESGDAVCVDTTGLGPGTYYGAITIVDANNSQYRSTVSVTLLVRPQQPVPITGLWAGTWTQQIGGFGNDYWSLSWNLVANGNSVAGTYTDTITSSDLGQSGTQSGSLLNGSIQGSSFWITTDGGTVFEGTINGSTITGTGTGGAFSGPFTIQKQ